VARDKKSFEEDWIDWAMLFGSLAVLAIGLDSLFDCVLGPPPSVAWRGWLGVLFVVAFFLYRFAFSETPAAVRLIGHARIVLSKAR
jgi:hypothetical protein